MTIACLLSNTLDLDFQRIEVNSFSSCEDISVDKAIMEKTDLGVVYPLKAGWNDIGSWQSMWEVAEKDNMKNVINGDVLVDKVEDSYIYSKKNLLVGIDLQNLIIVQTDLL